jgi:hypothetical protein
MSRTIVPGASTLGVTSQDVDAARRERDRLVAEHDDAIEAAQARLREMKEANDGVLPATAAVREEVQELFAGADQLGLEVDAARQHLARVQAQAYGSDPDDQRPGPAAAAAEQRRSRFSIAARLLESDAYLAAREQGLTGVAAFRQAVTASGGGIPVATVAETMQLLSLAATLEPLVGDDQSRLWEPSGLNFETPRILDLISVTTTDKDAVDYAVVTVDALTEGGAPYGTALPTSDITTEARTEAVKRRGTVMDVPEGVLSDESRLRTWLEQRMRRRIRLGTETQVLHGDGAGQNFTGIFNWAGVGSRAKGAGSVAKAILDALTDVRIAYLEEPDAVAIRPETWSFLLGEQGADNHYVNSAGPFGVLPSSMWGKQVAPTTVLRDGTGNAGADPLDALVGFFPEAELVVREGLEYREFEQNKDNVEKGMVTVRGQYRAAFVVNDPTAFVAVDLT